MSFYTETKDDKKKTDAILKYGKELGWKIEEIEIPNMIDGVGRYETADTIEEDAYPEPFCKYMMQLDRQNQSLEEIYYWFLNFLRVDLGFPRVDKIYDVFSASESSALWGNIGQRQSIQQDRASQYLRGIGELVRTLFQIVRELRILDERLEPYARWKDSKSADITLKSLFASLVEQGGNNPDSIYSLAAKVGFTVLPDLFFNTHVYSLDEIDEEIEHGAAKEFNNVLKTVLKRKLFAYINWKEKTEKEFTARRKFQIQYLRQHWNTIRLYMTWIKPYLKASKRLTARSSHLNSAELVGAFDSTRIDVEVLFRRPLSSDKKNAHHVCILASFSYKTKPNLTYKPEMQQQAVSHIGSCNVTFRMYGWHDKDIAAYKKMREEEDMDLLGLADEGVASAFEALKDELQKYLDEAEATDPTNMKNKKEKEELEAAKKVYEERNKKKSFFSSIEPFAGIFKGFGELAGSLVAGSEADKQKNVDLSKIEDEKEERNSDAIKKAQKEAARFGWVGYNIFKKAHKMLNW